ncbi:putative GABA permease [Thozetella sp. PMI_491]|nr:putative GABA permease [Thozetella sp. PMI_491]
MELRTRFVREPLAVAPGPEVSHLSGSLQQDDDTTLRRLGKKPLLERNFGFMSILGISCSALLSWESVLVSSVPGLLNGGPAGVVWGLLINWISALSVYAALAELASIAPTAGGQYHWVAMLAPAPWSPFLSYLTAWLTVLAWQAMAVSNGYTIATFLQGTVVLAQPAYDPQPYQTVLIIWAAILFAVLVNSTTGRLLARFEGLLLILHLAGFFGILVPLVYFAPHSSGSILTTFLNEGGWSTQALSFFVGFPTIATVVVGADCAVHMSEEIQSAAIVVPRALIWTVFLNGLLAFAMLVALIFCMGDIDTVLASTQTVFYPFLEIFQSAVQSTAGAVAMSSLLLLIAFMACVGVYASASRIMWSFARDKGLPFDKQLVKLTRSALPVTCVVSTLVITMLLSLIVLGSPTVLQDLLSLVLSALFSSYLLACTLLLWRRWTGAIQSYVAGNTDVLDVGHLSWGPWRVPEPFGTINNIYACVYSLFLLFWSFWPVQTPTTPATTNWSVLVFGSVIIFSLLWYAVRARHYFKGPVREL